MIKLVFWSTTKLTKISPKWKFPILQYPFSYYRSRPPLTYTWRKVEDPNASIKRYLKMSVQAKLKDHNRVLVIPNAQLYDIGWYECSVSRMHGLGATTAVHIDIKGTTSKIYIYILSRHLKRFGFGLPVIFFWSTRPENIRSILPRVEEGCTYIPMLENRTIL